MSDYYIINGELYHHGVKGMKWGHRKAQPISDTRARYDRTKSALKIAKKQYNKDFNNAYYKNNPYSISKKRRQASEDRWKTAIDSADALNAAKTKFKQARKERKTAINNTYKKIQKRATLAEKMLWNDATRKRAAKYVVDNNMSVGDAKNKATKEAIRNTASILAVIGAGYAAAKVSGKI